MAKARFTNKGNVRLTMTPLQYRVVNSVLDHCRLGDRNEAQSAISDLLLSLASFNYDYFFDEPEFAVEFTTERKDGSEKSLGKNVTIELVSVEDDEDEDDDE